MRQIVGGCKELTDRIPYNSIDLDALECEQIKDIIKKRIGSPSMHAEVYKTKNNLALKLVPSTNKCFNEVKYLNQFTKESLSNNLQHFPICLNIKHCRNVSFNKEILNFNAFDDIVEDNKEVCINYMKTNLRFIPDITKSFETRILKLSNTSSLGSVLRVWKEYKKTLHNHSSSSSQLTNIENLMSICFFTELANYDLRTLLEKKTQTVQQLNTIFLQIAISLLFLDSKGLKHGDLHFGNVLLLVTKPCSINYPNIGYTLNNIEHYVILWDFETMDTKTADENILEDAKTLFNSIATSYNIQSIQSSQTLLYVQHLNTHNWSNFDELFRYLKSVT
jgi:hypothetical protein